MHKLCFFVVYIDEIINQHFIRNPILLGLTVVTPLPLPQRKETLDVFLRHTTLLPFLFVMTGPPATGDTSVPCGIEG